MTFFYSFFFFFFEGGGGAFGFIDVFYYFEVAKFLLFYEPV